MTAPARKLDDLDLPFLDYHSSEYASDPAQLIDAARESSWLAKSIRGYEILSYPIASQLCLDKEHLDGIGSDYYAQQGVSELIIKYATEGMLPLLPWVRHDPIRRVLRLAFTGQRIAQMRPVMRSTAERLLTEQASATRFNLVSDFNDRYPIEVVCGLLGIPVSDIPQFSSWTVSLARLSHNPVEPFIDEIDTALRGLYGYFADLIDQRRAHPGEDFVSAVIEAEAHPENNDERLTESEMFGALVNLLFAGHDTTRLQLGWAVFLLMQHRDQWDLLVESSDLATGAIEESMRLRPSLHTVLRTVNKDLVVDGIHFPAGTSLSLNLFAANRDPVIFPQPDTFDIRRSNAAKHLTFGRGHRLCLGQALARAEMAEALAMLATHYPSLELDGTPEFTDPSAATHGPQRLMLRLSR